MKEPRKKNDLPSDLEPCKAHWGWHGAAQGYAGTWQVSASIGIWCMAAGCCTESWPCLIALLHLWISWRQVINRSTTELPLTVSYDKISLGRLRFWIHMQDAVYSLQQFGGWPQGPRPGWNGVYGESKLCHDCLFNS